MPHPLPLDPALQQLLHRQAIQGVRQLVWEWNHDMPMAEGRGRGIIAPDASVLLRGRKKPEDPLYQR